MADGSVVIDTKLDTKKLRTDISNVTSQLSKLAEKSAKISDDIKNGFDRSGATEKLNKDLATVGAEVESLGKQLEELGNKQFARGYYQSLVKETEKAASSFDKLFDKQEKMQALGVSENSAQWKNLQYDLESASNKYQELLAAKEKAEESGTAYVAGTETQEYKNLSAALEEAREKYAALQQQQAQTGGTATQRLSSLAQNLAGTVSSAWGRLIGNNGTLTKSFGGVMSSIKKLIPAMLAARGVMGILRKAVNAYMQENQKLSATLSSAWSGLGNLLGPIIDRIVNLVATAIAYVTQFLKLLGFVGKSAAKEIAGAGGSAKKETDKLKRTIASFDELNILNDKEEESGGGGGGGASADILSDTETPKWIELTANKILELIEPLKSIDFTPAEEAIGRLGESFKNLGTAIGVALEWAWFNILVPLSSWTIEEFVPTTINLLANAFALLNSVLQPLSLGFQNLMAYLSPVFLFLGDTVIWIISEMSNLFQKLAAVVEEKGPEITAILTNIGQIVSSVWAFIQPILIKARDFISNVLDFIGDVVSDTFGFIIDILYNVTEFLAGVFTGDWERAFSGIKGIVRSLGNFINNIFNTIRVKILQPFDNWLSGVFSTDWSESFGVLGNALNGFFIGVQDIWNGIKKVFDGITTFVSGVFSGNWKKAWDGVKQIFAGVWEALVGIIKTPINAIIGAVNALVSGVISGFNGMIGALNGIKFTAPNWVPIIGGKSLGFNIPLISAPQIPYLAKGAVIPPNAPFAAVLGDQRHGTNIEAPLSTIQEAVALVMDDNIAAMMAGFEAVVQAIREQDNSVVIGDDVIARATERYQRKMAVVRGSMA